MIVMLLLVQVVRADISNYTYTGFSFSLGGEDISPKGLFCNDIYFYVTGDAKNRIFEYNSTGNYTGSNFSVAVQDTSPQDLTYNGSHFYVAGDSTNAVYEYAIPEPIVDTCTAPGSGDWNVDCSDNCVLDSAQDVVADMHLNGAGTIVLSAPLTFTGTGSILSVGSGCTLSIESGGEIGGQ